MDYRDGYIELLVAERSTLKAKNKVLLAALKDCLKLDDIAPSGMFKSIHAGAREAIAKASAEPEQPCTPCNCVKCTTARTAGGTTDAPGYEETNDLLEAATEAMNPVGGE